MSQFVDQVEIEVVAGRGGSGSRSLHREKYVTRGGPDGGDGGQGGSVILEASNQKNTLLDFRFKLHFNAEHGENGGKRNRTGGTGKNLVLQVPCGTMARDEETGELLADLTVPGERQVIAQGGRGGRGNTHFATSTKQAPKLAELGEPGESRKVLLELKLLADVGLIGFPNAGKSTFLAAVSAARPKIANYPFTTLIPQLGVVRVDEERQFVVADLPGLIEGAAEGHGLGHRFLKHIERTRVLLFLLDGFSEHDIEPLAAFRILKDELRRFRPELAGLPTVAAVTKADLEECREQWPSRRKFLKKELKDVFLISSATGDGISELLNHLYEILKTAPQPIVNTQTRVTHRVYKPAPKFELMKDADGFVLKGKGVEKWVSMTDFDNREAVEKLKFILKKLGVSQALQKAGAHEGDWIRVGKEEFLYVPDQENHEDDF